MSAFLKFRPSASQDVVGYRLYCKPDDNEELSKDNATINISIGNPPVDLSDGFIKVELNTIPQLQNLDGTYDLGVAAVDDAGNESALLTQGLADIQLDFLAPSPPTEASVYWS